MGDLMTMTETMTGRASGRPSRRRFIAGAGAAFGMALMPVTASAQAVTRFKQAIAEAASNDSALAEFYKANDYDAIWTGTSDADAARRRALFAALADAGTHGLPAGSYRADALIAEMKAVADSRDLGRIEVELSRSFLKYATDLQTGILTPREVDAGLVLEVPLRDRAQTLAGFAAGAPRAFLRDLAPRDPEYGRLLRVKLQLEQQRAAGGWGARVPDRGLKPGATGDTVVALRNRLIAMGYMDRSATRTYDPAVQKAVQLFQSDNGLPEDGVAGTGTLTEVNRDIEDRLAAVVVALERERWMNMPRGPRHIWVNLVDFTTQIRDDDQVTFETRSVIGATQSDRRSPEFSDQMEMMVINPTWNVPRSITTKEYLPQLKRNPNAVSQLNIVDSRGRVVPRSSIDFAAYTARNFPYSMKQPPSNSNALGLVKFLFPNKYNIYLHDTPAKSLFGREVRAFSHGCIRLADPFDFAYMLLARQTDDPQGVFKRHLATGKETTVMLEQPVPVHLTYRTAFTSARGRINYRRDVYGRDGRIFAALTDAGVALPALQG